MSTTKSNPNYRESYPASFVHKVVTPDVLGFLEQLSLRFDAERLHLLNRRKLRQAEFDKGIFPDFLPETAALRSLDGDQCAELRREVVHGRIRRFDSALLGELY